MSQAASGTEGITALKDLNLQTVLAEEGEPRTTIVAPDGEGYREVADRIRTRVQDLAGVELPIASPADSSYDVLRTSNVLLLGNAQDNPLVRRMLWERWLFDTWYPGDDGFVVRSIHNPIGAGTNVIFIGGGAPGAAGAAADAFLDSLDPGDPLAVGWTMRIGEEDQRKAPDDGTIVEYTERADRALSFKNGRNLISGAATAARRYYDTGQEGWAEVFKVYMDRHKRLGEPGMGTHMNVYDAVSMWELIEESPVFADEDRLWITDHFLYVLRSGEGCMHSWMRRDIDIVGVRHNHQTLPGVVCLFGGRYFKLGYGLPEADEWMETGARLFDGQEISHKPQCDCNNYEWGTLYQTGWWSLGSGDYTFFDNGSCRTAADRAILEMDNRGFASSNGDCWTLKYFPETLFRQAAEYYQDGRYEWAIRKHGKAIGAGGNRGVADVVRDLEPQEPVDLLGICVAPMSPHFHNAHNTTLPDQPEPNIPLEDSFDKISFRRTFDSEDQYLLLDGIGTGSHGHVDVNGVSQFTDNDRIWLMDVSYAEAPGMRDHNVVTVLRNGKTEDPPPFAALDGTADLETVGFCQTSLSDYCGMDWTRSILWSKERYFLVFDRLVAREAGDFTMRVHWRTPGEGSLEGHTFAVDQQEREPGKGTRPVVKSSRVDAFALASVGADKTAVIHDRENVGKWFESYEYSDPVVSIVQQNRAVRMAEGDSHVFANVFFVSNAEDPVDVEMRSIGEGVVLVRDGERIVCAGVGPAAFDLGGQKVQVDAEQFVLGADTIALRAGRSVDWHCPVFTSETPADVEQATDDGDGRAADLAKAWVDAADREVSATGGVSQDSHGLRDRLLAKLDAPALCMAEGNVVGRPGGPREVAVGCANGHVHLLSREGESIWSFRAGGGINDLAIADIDGDGKGEVIAGSGDRRCYVLDSAGRERWHYEGAAGHDPYWGRYWKAGEVEKVLAADIDGDGDLEVVFGAANMHIHACDTDGELLWRFTEYGVCTSIMAADLTGDGRMEVIGGPAKITCNSTCHVIGADGTEIMRSGNDGWASALTAICSASLGADGAIQVVCGTNMNNVYALAPEGDDLERRWTYTAGDIITSMCAATLLDGEAQHVVVGSASEFVHLLDSEGTAVWDARLADPVTRVAAADVNGNGRDEVVASTRYAVYVLDGAAGEALAVYIADSPIVSFRAGEEILVVTEDGNVRVLQIVG